MLLRNLTNTGKKPLIPQMASSDWPQMASGHLQLSCLIQRSRWVHEPAFNSYKDKRAEIWFEMYFLLLAFCLQTPSSEKWKRQLGYYRLLKLLTTQTLKFVHWALCSCQEEGKAGLSWGSTQTQSVITNQTPLWIHKAVSRRETCSNLRFL